MTIEIEILPKPDTNYYNYKQDPVFYIIVSNTSQSTRYENLKVVKYILRGTHYYNYRSYTIKKMYYYSREPIATRFSGWRQGEAEASYDYIPWRSGTFYLQVRVYDEHGNELARKAQLYYVTGYSDWEDRIDPKLGGYGDWHGSKYLKVWVDNEVWTTVDAKAEIWIVPWLMIDPIYKRSWSFSIPSRGRFEAAFTYTFKLVQKYGVFLWAVDKDYSIIEEYGTHYEVTPYAAKKGKVWIEAPDYAQEGSEVTAKINFQNTDSYTGNFLLEASVLDENGNKIAEDSFSTTLGIGQSYSRSLKFTMPKRAKINANLYALYWKDWWDFPD